MKGLLINFEGIDACGKTTVLGRIEAYLQSLQIPYLRTKEPGGTKVGEEIRALLLDPSNKELDATSELLLYNASRAILVNKVILPALAEGKVVLCDRFYDSSIAYQGYGGEKSYQEIEKMKSVIEFATSGLKPNRTYFIDIPIEESLKRKNKRSLETSIELDRMEQKAVTFFKLVRAGFYEIAKAEQHRVKVIDGTGSPDEVFDQIKCDLDSMFL